MYGKHKGGLCGYLNMYINIQLATQLTRLTATFSSQTNTVLAISNNVVANVSQLELAVADVS